MAGSFSQRVRVAAKAAVGIFSDNSMKQAYGLLGGVMPGGMGSPPVRGTVDYLRAYSQMPWLRAVASRVSTATARAEWQLFVVRKQGGKARMMKHIQRADKVERGILLKKAKDEEELVQIVDHPMLDVLHNANDFQTGYAMRKITQLHMDLVGDAFWLKERDAQGTVIAVWPIPPHWVMATPTPAFRFFRVSFKAWRGNIPDTEFVWFSDPDPLNPYGRGTGAAMALGDELDTDEYAARHTKAFFYNSARPDLLVWPKEGNIREANVKRLENDWMSQSQGFFRSFKPYFLTREVGVKELEQNFRSLTLVQLREFERNVIMQQYGVPPEILGVLENSNRSTIDAADYFMSRYVVEPRLEFQRTVMQERLAPEYDERLIVEYVSPVQEDKEQHLAAAEKAPWSLTINEWRKLSGHGPLEDEKAGELHMVPNTDRIQPIEEYVEPPPPVVVAPPAPGAPPEKPDQGEPKPTAPGEGRRGIDLSGGWRDVVAEDAQVAALAGDVALSDKIVKLLAENPDLPPPSALAARHEPALARAVVRAWRDHAARVNLTSLTQALERGSVADVSDILAPEDMGRTLVSTVVPALLRAGSGGVGVGSRFLRSAGVVVRGLDDAVTVGKAREPRLTIDLNAVNQQVTLWAEQHAAALVDAPAAVREVIRLMVAQANEDGVPPRELAKLLQDVVGLTDRQSRAVATFRQRLLEEGVTGAKLEQRTARYALAQQRARALTIARTETIAAVNAGQQLLWEQAVRQGAIDEDDFERVWLVTEDDLLDTQVCEPLTDARAAIDEEFAAGIMQPPAHPNCRCAMGLVEKGR